MTMSQSNTQEAYRGHPLKFIDFRTENRKRKPDAKGCQLSTEHFPQNHFKVKSINFCLKLV